MPSALLLLIRYDLSRITASIFNNRGGRDKEALNAAYG